MSAILRQGKLAFGAEARRDASVRDGDVLDVRAFDLLCLTVACTLIVHLAHLPVWLAATLAALLSWRWLQRRTHRGTIPALLRFVLLAALPLAILMIYRTPFGRAPGTALAVGLLVLKLLESERPRDARMAVGFCCFVLMSALLFKQSLAMTLPVALALLPALATLRALQADAGTQPFSRLFAPGATLMLVSSPLALIAFVFVPRLPTPLWGAPGADVARTGVGDRMAPGDMRDLLIDDSPAMRVGFADAPPAPGERYFRGVVMWYFDGRGWTRGSTGARDAAPQSVVIRGTPLSYEVTLEPTRQRWLFALDVPLSVPDGAHLDADHTLERVRPVTGTIRYQASSATSYTLDPTLQPALRRAALQLPPGFDPRATALAHAWRAEYGEDDAAIVHAALALFRDGGFAYNLAAPPLGRDSVDDFLFGTRQGYCEHYAGAFAFLMRAAGIPARVVAGYHGGYWNDYAHYLLVRQSEAHAWDEVWLAGRGWVRVDPTAMVRRMIDAGSNGQNDAGEDGSGWLTWQDRLDVVNRLWDRSVIGFDALRQSELFAPLGVPKLELGQLATGLSIGMVAMLGLAMLVALRATHRPPRDALEIAQRRLLAKLDRCGLTRQPQEGPRDFFARCMLALPDNRAELAALARSYLSLRYGHAAPPAEPVRIYLREVRHFHARRVVK